MTACLLTFRVHQPLLATAHYNKESLYNPSPFMMLPTQSRLCSRLGARARGTLHSLFAPPAHVPHAPHPLQTQAAHTQADPNPRAALCVIGDEVLSGSITDTNTQVCRFAALWLCTQLAPLSSTSTQAHLIWPLAPLPVLSCFPCLLFSFCGNNLEHLFFSA